MQEGILSSIFPAVQLATPPKGAVQGTDNKIMATFDTTDSPHSSPATASGQSSKTEDVNDEMIPNTSSNVTVDSNMITEVMLIPLIITFHSCMKIFVIPLCCTEGFMLL